MIGGLFFEHISFDVRLWRSPTPYSPEQKSGGATKRNRLDPTVPISLEHINMTKKVVDTKYTYFNKKIRIFAYFLILTTKPETFILFINHPCVICYRWGWQWSLALGGVAIIRGSLEHNTNYLPKKVEWKSL